MFKVHQVSIAHSLEKGVTFDLLGLYKCLYKDHSRGRERYLMLGTGGGWRDKETGKYTLPIYFPKDARFLSPYDDEPINAEERQEIKANVKEALSALGADYQPKFTED